jgi:hypothetical protein
MRTLAEVLSSKRAIEYLQKFLVQVLRSISGALECPLISEYPSVPVYPCVPVCTREYL